MKKFTVLLKEEEKSKGKEKQTYESDLIRIWKNANKGTLHKDGVLRLVQQIKDNKLSYCGYPEWVLKSWIDSTKFGALPLDDNRWLDVKNIVNGTSEISPNDIIYSGFVVSADRKEESGIKAISLSRSHEIDIVKFKKLTLFKLASNEAKRIIEKTKNIKKDIENSELEKQQKQNLEQVTNNNTPNLNQQPSPAPAV